MKINKNIFSMPLFALSFILLLFSCNQPSGTGTPGNGNPEETQKEYPETISTGFEKPSPDTMDFSSLTGYIAAIKNLLQPEEALTPEGYREFLSSLQEGLAKIIPQDQDFPYTLLTNEYQGKNPSDIEEKQTSPGYNTEEYNSLYQTFKESLTALNTAYTSYKTAYNDYKSAYEGTPQTGNLSQLKELLKEVIKDFNDDFYFENEKLENTELSRYIEECVKEQTELKTKLQSYRDNESSFIYSQENFQQALSALRVYTPEEGTPPETFENVTIIYDANTIDAEIEKITDATKTINFIIPSGPLSISSVNEEAGTAEETPKIISDITKIKEKMQEENKDATFSISYENLDKTDVSINMDISVYDSEKDTIHEILNDLPKLDFTLIDVTGNGLPYADGNLYDKGIDTLIAKYFNADAQDKLSFDLLVGATAYYFDAKPALNGQTMYTKNDYNGNAYNLDINAALLMRVPVKNVEITGTNKTDETYMPTVTNVRVSSDVSDIIFGAGSGVVDFETAPRKTPSQMINSIKHTKIIIRNIKEGSSVDIGTNHTIDLSNLPVSSFQNIENLTTASFVEVYFAQGQENKGFGVSASNDFNKAIYVDGALTSVKDGYTPLNATNADWERAGNTDGGIPTIPQNTANVSQANVKSVKSLVMKRLLDDNQRVYG